LPERISFRIRPNVFGVEDADSDFVAAAATGRSESIGGVDTVSQTAGQTTQIASKP